MEELRELAKVTLEGIMKICAEWECCDCPFANQVENIYVVCPFQGLPEDWEV